MTATGHDQSTETDMSPEELKAAIPPEQRVNDLAMKNRIDGVQTFGAEGLFDQLEQHFSELPDMPNMRRDFIAVHKEGYDEFHLQAEQTAKQTLENSAEQSQSIASLINNPPPGHMT